MKIKYMKRTILEPSVRDASRAFYLRKSPKMSIFAMSENFKIFIAAGVCEDFCRFFLIQVTMLELYKTQNDNRKEY